MKVFLALIAIVLTPPALVAQTAFDPATGYRISQYRAPTPASVPGGTVVTLEDVQRLVRDHRAVLIDVLPSEGAGADPATGIWHVPKPHQTMAGAVWLPDTGKGTLSPTLDAYFQNTLASLTAGDKSRPVILFCQADCWMSWNAVKRAAGYGYSALYWYPDGTDGMRDWDIPLIAVTPIPMKPVAP